MSTSNTIASSKPSSLLSALLLWGLVGLFVVSGAAGLIYQVLWVRLLSLSFGITVFAVTVVLSSFMAGLALGSFFGGRIAERLKQPLLIYGYMEIGVGLVALATPWAFDALQHLYPVLYRAVGEHEALLFLVRVTLSFILLVIPTTLMGATLPIIVKSSLARSGELGSRIGLLYTANTFGAIGGAAIAGFWLIGGLGITSSIMLAAGLNAIVGIAAMLLQRIATTSEASQSELPEPDVRSAYPTAMRRATLIAYGLSGLCSFAYEVVWTRMLSLVLDTSIYAFVTMLFMVLLGITVGSAVMTSLLRQRWNWPMVFVVLEVLIAGGALWAMWAAANMGEIRDFFETTRGFRRFASTSVRFNFVVAGVTILPTTLLIGATFPVAARVYTAGMKNVSVSLGEIYSVNVFGAIFGSMLGGFILLPVFGTQTSMLVLSLVSLGVAGLLALSAEAPALPRRIGLIAGSTAVFLTLWLVKPDLYAGLFSTRFPEGQVIWFREGLETTVSVVRDDAGVRTLYTNSRGQANTEPGLVHYHRRIGQVPLLVRPGIQDILIVGLGGGHTSGTILQHPGTRIQVVELSESMIDAAREFTSVNYNVVTNPNLSVRIGDGRNYLLTTDQKYDMISSDTIQPYDAGSTNLYSVEYYRLVQSALKTNGIMAQWIGPQDDDQYKIMLRSFVSVFPYVTLWLTADLAIGSNEPIMLDLQATARRFESPEARRALADAGFHNPADVVSTFVADRDEILRFVGEGPILSDDRPLVEYYRSLPGGGLSGPPDIWSFSRDASKVLKP
ncbi:MAG: fused MFS/spermidine synthase [Chloroflexota bacterium]